MLPARLVQAMLSQLPVLPLALPRSSLSHLGSQPMSILEGRLTHWCKDRGWLKRPGAKCFTACMRFAGKRVLVVGGSFSGADLAVEIAAVASCVVHVVSRPFWPVPR